jgi:hypothetical protein
MVSFAARGGQCLPLPNDTLLRCEFQNSLVRELQADRGAGRDQVFLSREEHSLFRGKHPRAIHWRPNASTGRGDPVDQEQPASTLTQHEVGSADTKVLVVPPGVQNTLVRSWYETDGAKRRIEILRLAAAPNDDRPLWREAKFQFRQCLFIELRYADRDPPGDQPDSARRTSAEGWGMCGRSEHGRGLCA